MRKPVCFVCGKEAEHQIGEAYVCRAYARNDVCPPPSIEEQTREIWQNRGFVIRSPSQEGRGAKYYGISVNDAAGRWLREHDPDLKRSSKGN